MLSFTWVSGRWLKLRVDGVLAETSVNKTRRFKVGVALGGGAARAFAHVEGVLAEMGRIARRGLFNTLMVTKTALVNEKAAASSYAFLIDDLNVGQTRIPIAAVALNLWSGEAVVLN